MKAIIAVRIVACCLGTASAALIYSQVHSAPTAVDLERARWVAECLKDFESIKVGMTRSQIEQRFPLDGGIQGVSIGRFAHPACPYFKIDASFEFKRNAADQNRAIRADEDKVVKVSKPYIESPFYD
jgi:hypothetical protein